MIPDDGKFHVYPYKINDDLIDHNTISFTRTFVKVDDLCNDENLHVVFKKFEWNTYAVYSDLMRAGCFRKILHQGEEVVKLYLYYHRSTTSEFKKGRKYTIFFKDYYAPNTYIVDATDKRWVLLNLDDLNETIPVGDLVEFATSFLIAK